MGTIQEKMDYLAETKQKLREALEEMGATVTDEDTFRSYAEKILDLSNDGEYIRTAVEHSIDGSVDNRKFEHTILGDIKFDYTHMICPKINYPENFEGTAFIPFSLREKHAKATTNITNGYASYHRVTAPETCSLKMSLIMEKPALLILPPCVDLAQYTLVNGNRSNYDIYSFSVGLGFGKSVHNSVSTWISNPISNTEAKVRFPKDFLLSKGKTLYLNMIFNMRQEDLRDMIQNLYDYVTNDGETPGRNRYISIGSSNKSRLTDDEIALAESKGWGIS